MVLFVVFMNKSMRTTINVLLFNLSLSDILYIILSVPGYLSTEICNQRWTLGLAMARICQGFAILSAAASIFTLIGIAFERLELYFIIYDYSFTSLILYCLLSDIKILNSKLQGV
jgi:hypothetical protein